MKGVIPTEGEAEVEGSASLPTFPPGHKPHFFQNRDFFSGL
jgi:hypothetical protein